MATLAFGTPLPAGRRERVLALCGMAILGLIAAAVIRQGAHGSLIPPRVSPWLIIHLASIIPALPLGAFILARPKGDRLHRISGWVWCVLMIVAALSSFGLTSLQGHLSWIHLLSILTLYAIPRAILNARRGRIMAHRKSVQIVYGSMVIAGLFVFVPGRLLGNWLFGL